MKSVLFDENMPRKLRRDFPELHIRTAQERAATKFDVIVTIDQTMRYQQNVAKLDIGIVVIELRDTRLVHLRALVPAIRTAIEQVRPGEVLDVIPPAS
ncbi:MAG TPA: hypothetical protein VM733_13420 [Thermoanaerobaculia bacterium]|nr:hypothetical protein [Thermoanaerobaculia bacterium]